MSGRKGPAKATGVGGSLSIKSDREGHRKTMGQRVDHLRPDQAHFDHAAPAIEGEEAYCSRCGAVYHRKHWHVDAGELARLQADPRVTVLVCPGCTAIEQEDWHGQVRLMLAGSKQPKDQILNTLYNEEAKLRTTNPHARIGRLDDLGEEIDIVTTSGFLAERLAKELEKAVHGSQVKIDRQREENFTRVMWWTEEAAANRK